ncbi:hypothetical protein K437DRAFT_255137 [Tilletiaria anomala UBC 951]|uniref:Small secreted protein n=1 Tax=Tilletiaria anomala (strain ATCC 24038 / CBS 436.72 / UBC 951) TaxID=1037660 RepID=A0A066WH91_TILAU|nr:uncharacterized protein K437DRAFT_255137 [Tilletiaria anomala UBC 951]KDN50419.1 hypothetical protein K437DRAFT_255137 [Tilletiaria anomala UBC 951]
MNFFTSTLAVINLALLVSAAPNKSEEALTKRVDNRQLVSFQGGDGAAFCKAWKCACVNYEPTNTALYFQATYCQPGDFSGKNTNTEARVYCTFTDGTTQTQVVKHIAAETGATLVN